MSSPSLQHDQHAAPDAQEASTTSDGQSLLTSPVRTVGFWSAVALPFLHIPLLVSGLDTTAQTMTFLALLSLNVLALVVGRQHNAD